MVEIIDLSKRMFDRKNQWAVDAMEVLQNHPQGNEIITLITDLVAKECEAGLGLIEVDGDDELHFFNMIHEIYQRAADGCYFCSDNDPNAQEVDMQTKLCIMCKMKMANFLQFIGLFPGKFLKGIGSRQIQKSKMGVK